MSDIRWTTPPETLQRNVEKYGDRVETAVSALVKSHAQRGQDNMRHEAPWTDRTGNARNGLFGVPAQPRQGQFLIYFIHGMAYGVHLELRNGGKYAVVYPITLQTGNELMRDARKLLSD